MTSFKHNTKEMKPSPRKLEDNHNKCH